MSGLVREMSEGGTTRYSETEVRALHQIRNPPVTPGRHGSDRRVPVEPRKLIAVESTPERSLSLLFSTSRAAEATTGWGAPATCGVAIIAHSV